MTRESIERAARFAVAAARGRRLDPATAAEAQSATRLDPDARVRAGALGALVRVGPRGPAVAAWRVATGDPAPAVRRRAAELAPALSARARRAELTSRLVALADDADVTVVEAACWAMGELGRDALDREAIAVLARVGRAHGDPLAREAAIAALGALGDPAGLETVLAGCADKPTVRRRAVLALAAFNDPRAEEALRAAAGDRDWQVRQAAEDLLQA